MASDEDKGTKKRFWSKVAVRGDEECWPWTAYCDSYGYGIISVDGRNMKAHRVALSLSKPVGEDDWVLHSCDNPRCCNPRHLRTGTPADNSADCVRRGRSLRGEGHPAARLSREEVNRIRCSSESQRALAARYGISKTHVGRIKSGAAWNG